MYTKSQPNISKFMFEHKMYGCDNVKEQHLIDSNVYKNDRKVFHARPIIYQ